MRYLKTVRRLVTPAVLAAGALVAGQVWAGFWAGFLLNRDSNDHVTVISNDYEYGNALPLLGPSADQALISGLFAKVTSVVNPDAVGLKEAFNKAADCKGESTSRLIWFSGHAGLVGEKFTLIGQPSKEAWAKVKGDESTSKMPTDLIPLEDLLPMLGKSNCQFVIGIDAHGGKVDQLPANVTLIWGAPNGRPAFETKDAKGSYLTHAFASVFAAQRVWSPTAFTEALNNALGAPYFWIQGKSEFRFPQTRIQESKPEGFLKLIKDNSR